MKLTRSSCPVRESTLAKRAEKDIIHGMEVIYGTIAAVLGAALGWVQFRLLKGIVTQAKWWLFAVKLPLWALCMLAAAYVSIAALAAFVAGATLTFLAFGCAYWRKNKGV